MGVDESYGDDIGWELGEAGVGILNIGEMGERVLQGFGGDFG